jgi:hypothetical protein
MRIRPTGYDLLSAARRVLREAVLPHVPADERQTIGTIDAAMAFAAHKLERELPPQPEDLDRLKAARAALRGNVLAQLPKSHQYDARLVAKAVAIATNELANGNAAERDELDRLAALLHDGPQEPGAARDVRQRLALLYARLAVDIRQGRADPGSPRFSATHAHLLDVTRQALRESNPAYLELHAASVSAGKDAT